MRKLGWLLLPAIGVAPVLGQDARLDYELRAGVAYSDNAGRIRANPTETTIAVAGASVRGAREEGRLQYALAGDASYLDYLESDLTSEVVGSLFATSSYDILPQSVRWTLDGSFSQIREDLLLAAAPENREDVINISTGPSFRARFGDAFEAELDARYSIADFSERGFDSDTKSAQLVLARRASERSVIGIGASRSDVSYDSTPGVRSVDFERTEAFARFRTRGARTEIKLDVGYANAEGLNVDDSGALVRLEATRRLTPFISGFARYVQEYPTSEASVFVPFEATAGGTSADSSVLTATPRIAKVAEVGLRLNRPRTTGEMAFASSRETDIVGSFGSRNFDTARVSLSRALTPRSSATLFGVWSQEDLPAFRDSADEYAVGGSMGVTLGRHLGVDLRVEYRERNSPIVDSEFSEISAGLFLRWGRAPTVTPTAFLPRGND